MHEEKAEKVEPKKKVRIYKYALFSVIGTQESIFTKLDFDVEDLLSRLKQVNNRGAQEVYDNVLETCIKVELFDYIVNYNTEYVFNRGIYIQDFYSLFIDRTVPELFCTLCNGTFTDDNLFVEKTLDVLYHDVCFNVISDIPPPPPPPLRTMIPSLPSIVFKPSSLLVADPPKVSDDPTMPKVSGDVDLTKINMSGGATLMSGGVDTTLNMSGGATLMSGGVDTTLNMSSGVDATVNMSGGVDATLNMSGGTTLMSGGVDTTLNMNGGVDATLNMGGGVDVGTPDQISDADVNRTQEVNVVKSLQDEITYLKSILNKYNISY